MLLGVNGSRLGWNISGRLSVMNSGRRDGNLMPSKEDGSVWRRFLRSSLRLGVWCVLALCLCILAGCAQMTFGSQQPQATEAPRPTPTVDIGHVREVFRSGGELTYEEAVALKHDIIGDPPDPSVIT